MIKNENKYKENIEKLLKSNVYNLGKSAEVGGEYIINAVKEKIDERRSKNEK